MHGFPLFLLNTEIKDIYAEQFENQYITLHFSLPQNRNNRSVIEFCDVTLQQFMILFPSTPTLTALSTMSQFSSLRVARVLKWVLRLTLMIQIALRL